MSSYLGNLPIFEYKTSEWAIFKSRLEQFLLVNSVKEAANKGAILITHLSDESYRLLRDLAHPKTIKELSFDQIVDTFDKHFRQRKCTFADKAKFFGAMKNPGESVSEWSARLRGLASYCDFGSALETNLRDRFVLGFGSGPERDKLFEQDPITLTFVKAIEIAEQAAYAREAKAVVVKEEPIFRAQMEGGIHRGARNGGASARYRAGAVGDRRDSSSTTLQCKVCGLKNHSEFNCRYKSYKCKKCGKKGHLKKVCSVRVNNLSSADAFDCVTGSGESSECEECQMFNLRYVISKPIKLIVTIGKQRIKMELDSGSGTSVISEEMYKNMFSYYKLHDCNVKMCLYDGHKISPLGFFDCELTYNNETKVVKIFVIKNGGPPLLGRDFMSAFNLTLTTKINNIKSEDDVLKLMEQYPDLWRDELGTFNKFKVHLQLKENSVPKFFKPRTVPFALKEKVETELNRLVQLGILVPVSYSKYATPIVPVVKENGKVRIAGDFSVTLNQDLVIDKYPLPRIEEVFAKLGGGEHYSKIDLKNAYNQFVLSDESQELTTINTQKGLFKYTRLVYGLANAPAIFQKTMETLLSGIDGVSCWLDDICITGPNKVVHLQRLNKVLHRLNDAGLRLQREKCEFFKKSVTYLGYTICKNGLQTSSCKVQAILNSPEPTNVTEVKRFIGMVNYYRNFIPNASEIMSPLHELLRANNEWVWGAPQREAVQRVKRELASERVLAHFDPAAQLVLSVDAGPAGLGAVLAQHDEAGAERPLAYASRTLNSSEKNYSQIHKEATAIIFGVKKFHAYLYGRNEPFLLKTDHRPLVSIFNNKTGISKTSALRLQRYAIILSAYNYNVQYTTGERNVVADYFSRAPLPDIEVDSDGQYDTYTSLKFLSAISPAIKHKDIIQATEKDKILQMVIKYMIKGWPRKIKCKLILPYFQCKTDLQTIGGCLLRGPKVVVPGALRNRMLDELHNTHLGIVKMKSNARSRMWWPGIDQDIERRASACVTCMSVRPMPPRAQPAPWPRPIGPWQRIHIDYMQVGQKTYLVVNDAFSKWIECLHMANGTATQALITKLKYLFSVFGIPNLIVSDNDAKINSGEFKEFCSINGIKYMTSPIYHPCSNGQAENSVRICKNNLKCILKENVTHQGINEKLLDYLFVYRNTIHCTTGETPAKLMFGREMRTRLDLILPKEKEPTFTLEQTRSQANTRLLTIGQKVWARWYKARKESWVLGKILQKIGSRMYRILLIDDKSECIRHIDQLLRYENSKDGKKELDLAQGLSTSPPPAVRFPNAVTSNESVNLEGAESINVDAEDGGWIDGEEQVSEGEREMHDVSAENQRQSNESTTADLAHDDLPPPARSLRPRLPFDYKKYF